MKKKYVTVDQFIKFGPCYGADGVRDIAGKKKRFTAMDVLKMEDIPAADRLWAVLREEFIDAPILHEFACLCAENALKLVDKPDPRSVSAIETKRRWLRGDATDEELEAASAAASAAARADASAAARAAARAAAKAAQIKLLIDMLEP